MSGVSTMESLLKNNAESFSLPAARCGARQVSALAGILRFRPVKVARTPAQFALEHGLLLDEQGKPFSPEQALKNGLPSTELPAWGNARLDGEKALRVLTEQLGKRFGGYEGLSPCRRALAVAFLAYAGGDKKGCVSLLDAVSLFYSEENGQAYCPLLEDGDFTNKLKKQWERHASVLNEKCLSIHAAYELPWFMALLYPGATERRAGQFAVPLAPSAGSSALVRAQSVWRTRGMGRRFCALGTLHGGRKRKEDVDKTACGSRRGKPQGSSVRSGLADGNLCAACRVHKYGIFP